MTLTQTVLDIRSGPQQQETVMAAPASKTSKPKATEATPEATDNGETSEGTKRPQPDDLWEVVDELPEQAVNARSMEYHNLLTRVGREAPGQIVAIKQFHSENGASMVRRDLQRGERNFPGNCADVDEGDDRKAAVADVWEFASRTMDTPNGRESRLFAKFLGNDIDALVESATYLND